MIELRNVSKVYYKKDAAIDALTDIFLRVEKGEIYGVIGASGAGKSTLIRCINLLERPTQGQVIVNGQELGSLPASQLALARRNIGMIFQHFNLLSSRTVYGNVALPLELTGTPCRDIDRRVHELLELVGLADRAKDYPARLSGGQKQRVAIARTLASKPDILLCDEATSALDPETTVSILSLLKDINKNFGITILLITHEMNVVRAICDRVAVVADGRLVEEGRVKEVFANPKHPATKRLIASSLHYDIDQYQKTGGEYV